MTSAAAQARANALSVEVKKHAYRQTQDGIVISFVMHPNDVSPELAAAALGTRYMAALVEIGDDEMPVDKTGKARQRFHELPIAQQAAMRCQEKAFWDYLAFINGDETSPVDATGAAADLRAYFRVTSRKDINPDTWRKFDDEYQLWCRT